MAKQVNKKIVLEDGSIYSIYADAQIRSVRYVADRALEDTARDWTEDQLNVLNSFATPKQ